MSIEREAKLNETLEHILNVLKTQYEPEKVILFGSLADDSVSEWSNIDLAIIKETSLPFLDRLEEVALLCRAGVGVDYLVYTPDEFAQMIADENPFILEIIQQGRVLYERQPAATVA